MSPMDRAVAAQDLILTTGKTLSVISDAITAAVAEERERCAKIVEPWASGDVVESHVNVAALILERIRCVR